MDDENVVVVVPEDVKFSILGGASGSTATAQSSKDLQHQHEHDLTQKFLSGEITFAQYSCEWYEKLNEEDDDVYAESTVTVTNTRTSRLSYPASVVSNILRRQRRRTHLNTALLGLMGEANLRFVRGEVEVAKQMCMEIIRQVPTASEPYQTLAQIHESDPDKSLQYSLLAAHLNPSDPDEWMRLAEISRKRHDYQQEMICYTSAIKADCQNLSLHIKRIELLHRLEEINFPISNLRVSFQMCYHKIVKSLPPSEGTTILDYAKKAATLYHKSNEMEKALDVMRDAYNKCATSFTMEDLNLLLELLLNQQLYRDCVEVLIATAGVEIEATVETIAEGESTHEQICFDSCRIPEAIPIDLKTKLLICFINLRADEIVDELMQDFITNDVEIVGDLFMDVEEALSAVGKYDHSLKLLELLLETNQYSSLGAVWLRHAECLINLSRENEAINSLQKVIQMAPQHADARRKLYSILQKSGQHTEAVNSLRQDYTNPINISLLYEYCCIQKEQGNFERFLEAGSALLSRTFTRYRHTEELKMARYMKTWNNLMDNIYNFRVQKGEDPYDPDSLVFSSEDTLSPEVEWNLLQELVDTAYQLKKYVAIEKLSFGAFTSKCAAINRQELEFLCLKACVMNKDYTNSFQIIRDYTVKLPQWPRIWNLYNVIKEVDSDANQLKYIKRIKESVKEIVPQIPLFLGNSYLSSGRYMTSLQYYLEYHEKHPEDALAPLLIGVVFLCMACQRTTDKHHSLVAQGLSFLFMYKKLRNYDQESYYNIARAYHMLSLNSMAIHYYKKALDAPSVHCEEHDFLNMRREAAFNLYQLCKDNSPALAWMILQKHLVF